MTGHVVSPRARADLNDIWDYTADHWGLDQAERYFHVLRQAIEAIARNPGRGRPCDEVRPGYRRYAVGSHMIFFRIVGDHIDIVRVLHQRMDFEQHL